MDKAQMNSTDIRLKADMKHEFWRKIPSDAVLLGSEKKKIKQKTHPPFSFQRKRS